MSLFCRILKERKDYNYFKFYCNIVEEEKSVSDRCQKLDYEIQGKELLKHLEKNKDLIHDRAIEEIDWVCKNAKNFRMYLNTLKLVYVILDCENKDMKNVSWEEFCEVCEKINQLKSSYLDNIFN